MRRLPFLLTAALLVVGLLSPSAPARAGEAAKDMGFDEARAAAAERGVPVVVDFFTDWCVYCKHFDRDLADAGTGIAAALEDVVFVSIDAEKGEGIELAKRYSVRGFPTYAVLDAEGELIESWAGYGGPDHFLPALERALEDPTTLVEKKARYEESPTAADAQTLARIASAQGDGAAALQLYREARALDESLDLGTEIIYAALTAARSQGPAGFTMLQEVVAEEAGEGASIETLALAAQLMTGMGDQMGQPELGLPYLEKALVAIEEDPDALEPRTRDTLELMGLLKVREDVDAAVAKKKSMMPEGWMDSASELNGFAWWCFQNEINLEEAEQLARRGVELAEPGAERAMILDTAAEICNLLGNCGEAVELIKLALVDQPEDDHYQEQLVRFEKILAEAE